MALDNYYRTVLSLVGALLASSLVITAATGPFA